MKGQVEQACILAANKPIEETAPTLPALLLARCEKQPNGVALRVKKRGIYQEVTWAEYGEQVERTSAALRTLGLREGDRVAILADPCPEWLYAEMGTLAAGGICYGIYPTSSAEQVMELLEQGGASFLIAEDQEQVDKVLPFLDRLLNLRRVVVLDTRGMFAYDHPKLLAWGEFLGLGSEHVPLRVLVQERSADAPAIIIFTSGTTGQPRGAVYTHRTIYQGALDYRAALVPPEAQGWRTICHLPLNHAFEQWNSVLLPLIAPVTPHFGEDAARFSETLFEVAPDLYASVPRFWQKMAAQVLVALDNTSPEKRLVYDWAMRVGRRYVQARWQGHPSLALRLAYRLAWLLAFRPILDKLGLTRVRVGVTAGGPIPCEVQTLWQIWGVNLKNLYGQTEAGFVSVQRTDFPRPGDVGTVCNSVEVRLAPDGEILVRSPGSCIGYWQNMEASRELRVNGWIRTGDVGELLPNGALRLIDRKKDIIITAGGKNISPLTLEDRLRASRYISEAVVFGEGRKYLTALIEIDYETVAQWARAQGLTYSSFTDLATHEAVVRLLRDEVARVNRTLARVEQIKDFRIIPRELDPEAEGEPVTPTRKVKRQSMYERFRDLVEAMYDESEARLIGSQTREGPG